MTPPLCIQCHTNPVRRWHRRRPPVRGRRIVDGVSWRWFCSQACVQTDKAKHQEWRASAADARIEAAAAERRRELDGEVEGLARFGVPRDYARAVLDRVAFRWFRKGERGAFYRYVERKTA